MQTLSDITDSGIIVRNTYDKYEAKNPIARYLMKRFVRALNILVSRSGAFYIHEVGCGEGNLSINLAKQGKVVCASDFSKQIIKKAQENAKRNMVQIEFKVRSIYDLLPSEDKAELVICCEVLEHLEEPFSALSILARLADPYLIVSVPNEPLWRILNLARGGYVKSLGNTPGHIQHWSKRNFLKMLSLDFDIVKTLTPLPWIMVLCRTKRESLA